MKWNASAKELVLNCQKSRHIHQCINVYVTYIKAMLGISIQHHFFVHIYIMQLGLELYETSAKPFLISFRLWNFIVSLYLLSKSFQGGVWFPGPSCTHRQYNSWMSLSQPNHLHVQIPMQKQKASSNGRCWRPLTSTFFVCFVTENSLSWGELWVIAKLDYSCAESF